jgi:hypothetical protein
MVQSNEISHPYISPIHVLGRTLGTSLQLDWGGGWIGQKMEAVEGGMKGLLPPANADE